MYFHGASQHLDGVPTNFTKPLIQPLTQSLISSSATIQGDAELIASNLEFSVLPKDTLTAG